MEVASSRFGVSDLLYVVLPTWKSKRPGEMAAVLSVSLLYSYHQIEIKPHAQTHWLTEAREFVSLPGAGRNHEWITQEMSVMKLSP